MSSFFRTLLLSRTSKFLITQSASDWLLQSNRGCGGISFKFSKRNFSAGRCLVLISKIIPIVWISLVLPEKIKVFPGN
ncbi:unnamed protein product [Bemisia tabaci]|uniref:Uncharacterized protein n=1 Tax=Bemisia tabaci TaxID=7038 RepID=A0AAI8UU43_BEMTA|nr:unnamed protein product [Bemisia tabaci]